MQHSLIILFFFGISFISSSYSFNKNVQIYNNTQMGLKFEFPLSWELQSVTTKDKNCNPFCDISFIIPSDGFVEVSVKSYNLNDSSIQSKCICNTLEEFVNWVRYHPTHHHSELVSDKPVMINNNISGHEIEYKVLIQNIFMIQSYNFYTLQNDVGYVISYTSQDEIQYEKHRNEVQNMINSLKFLPIDMF